MLSVPTASSTQQNLPSLQVSTAIEQTPNSGIGISDKELDELAKIADELRIPGGSDMGLLMYRKLESLVCPCV
ncbi:hypothetical protein V6N13_028957 [Hibiscus sabdariffa]|uniref:Uncharacterized protein n=1 Tax=Hibiscus sabdariffa TaxID=183260 RepID=A0ABR2AMN2_9ROSI